MREADLYRKAGASFGEAHSYMAAQIKLPFCPPSFDVFTKELDTLNKGAAKRTFPKQLAEMIVTRARAKGNART